MTTTQKTKSYFIGDLIESAAKTTASDSVLLNKTNEHITITDLKTEAVFTVKDKL